MVYVQTFALPSNHFIDIISEGKVVYTISQVEKDSNLNGITDFTIVEGKIAIIPEIDWVYVGNVKIQDFLNAN